MGPTGKNTTSAWMQCYFSADGVKPNSSQAEAITKMAAPTNVEQLRQVLGLINFVGKFLPDLSIMLHPLTSLLRKDTLYVVLG